MLLFDIEWNKKTVLSGLPGQLIEFLDHVNESNVWNEFKLTMKMFNSFKFNCYYYLLFYLFFNEKDV